MGICGSKVENTEDSKGRENKNMTSSNNFSKLSVSEFAKLNYPDFRHHTNMVSDYLTPEVYAQNVCKVTSLGGTLDKCIQCGVDMVTSPHAKRMMGILACDEEAYQVFRDIFDKVIEEKHKGFKPNHIHVKPNLDSSIIQNGELDSDYVISCRIRTGRNVKGYSLQPSMSRAERKIVEKAVVDALKTLDGDQAGKYLSLEDMSDEDRDRMIEEHVLFDKPTGPLLKTGGMARDWPSGRGIWCNNNDNFYLWVNEEDHMRVISMEKGGDMKSTFDRFCDCLKKVENVLIGNGTAFQHSDRLGYICSCPSNLGTGLRCSVLIRIPNLNKKENEEMSTELFKLLRLQKRGTHGENSDGDPSISDLSNSERLGIDEAHFVQNVIDAVNIVIKVEKSLADGEDYAEHMEEAKARSEKIKPVFNEADASVKYLDGKKVSVEEYTTTYRLGEALNTMKLPLMDNYPNLTKHSNHLADVLTKEMYQKYAPLKTSTGSTLDMCMQCGVDTPGHPHIKKMVGLVACDEECFDLFPDMFDRIVEIKHKMPKDAKHCPPDLNSILDSKLNEDYVLSCRIRTGRSISGLPLPPACNRLERREVESVISESLNSLIGEFEGKYFPLMTMEDTDQQQLIKDHFLFGKPEGALLTASRCARDWPDARGIWHNKGKNFLVWINEEDHMRIIAMEKGGDMGAVFSRFCEGLVKVENVFKKRGRHFQHSDRLGYICTCPTNLGTGLRCSVHMKLIHLGTKEENAELFDEVLTKLRLQKRGSDGENDKGEFGVFDISNFERMNRNEFQLVQHVCKCVNVFIELEKKLEKNEPYNDVIAKMDEIAKNY